MYKFVVVFYLVCFFCYVWFSRQPDYFDGEFATANIHLQKDAANHTLATANFLVGNQLFSIDALYPLRSLTEGEKVTVIYELAQPAKAAVYSWWGYWIKIPEILFSIVAIIVLFQIAVGITSNPTPEALLEQLNDQPIRKTKYD